MKHDGRLSREATIRAATGGHARSARLRVAIRQSAYAADAAMSASAFIAAFLRVAVVASE